MGDASDSGGETGPGRERSAGGDAPPFGIGVVGLGVMGRRFVASLQANPDTRLVAVYDPAPASGDGLPRAASLEALLADPAIRCVYIATPPASHAGLVAAASAAGKAVFCEKPLTASPAAARACLEAVEGAGVPAAVNFPLATARAALRLNEIVASGALGSPLRAHVRARFRTWPRGWQQGAAGWLAGPAEGGFTREVVSHFVFLAQRLFGPGRLAESRIERGTGGTETRMEAVLDFAGCRLTLDAAVEGEVEDTNRFEVVGPNGTASISDWYRLQYGQEEMAPMRADASQVEDLVALLRGRPSRLATFHEAAAVVDVVEGILAGPGEDAVPR